MSENGDGLHGRIIKEEEESMREAIDEKMFANQSSSFMNPDDELLSWLQYPIDDDMFHHLPPPLTASPVAPAPADCFSSPSFFPLSTLSSSCLSSSSLSASPFAVKHLPQLENDAFTVAKNLSRRGVVDDWILHKEDLENENLPGEHTIASKNKGALVSLEGSFGMRNHYEAYRLENRGDKRAEMWANRVLDSKQGFVKDSRILAHLKPTVMEEREAQVAPSKSVPHSKHSALQRATPSHEDEHTNMMLTADSSQIEEGRGMQRRAEAQEEDLLQFQQASNEGYWLEDNVDMQLDTEERVPTIGRLQALSNADAALALGAGRAAGIIKPPGMEAFSKVRTSLQPTQIVPLGSPSISSRFSLSNVRTSLQPTQRVLSGSSALSSSFPTSIPFSGETLLGPAFSNWMSTTLRPVGPFESIPVSQLSYQTGETKLLDQARLLIPRPSAGFSDMGSEEDQFSLPKKISTIRSDVTKTFSLEPPPRVALLSPRDIRTPTDGTNSVLLREETMAGVSGGTVTSDLETTDMQKLSSASFLSQEITAGTCSGGSQTSGSLKEALSGLKRKLEDSECLSEEADEDSVVSSQARTSNSKRPRANEVHNLSERRRRNRINDKMNALRELIPHASKSNKAALLDEAIDYLKNLQLQLQVMSLRTGVSLLPVVLPPSMPHMPIPDCRPLGSMGMDLSGGSALANAVPTMGIAINKAYTVPARPFGPVGSLSGSVISTDLKPLQPLEANHSFSQLQGLSAHSHVQASSQSNFPINLNMCNSPHRDQYQQQQPQKQL